eukprot:1656788-Amphidinium_carterae.1
MAHCIERQEPIDTIVVQSDCTETRKSTCCGVIRWVGVILVCFSETQNVITISNTEAEYLGAGTAVAEGQYVQEILKFFGFPATVRLKMDASSHSSAMAIASRCGLGKAKHLHFKFLWLQQLVACGSIKLIDSTYHSLPPPPALPPGISLS